MRVHILVLSFTGHVRLDKAFHFFWALISSSVTILVPPSWELISIPFIELKSRYEFFEDGYPILLIFAQHLTRALTQLCDQQIINDWVSECLRELLSAVVAFHFTRERKSKYFLRAPVKEEHGPGKIFQVS